MHTSDFSDGLQTVEELAQHAGKIGLKEIAITDHSDVCVAMFRKKYKFMSGPSSRWTTRARRNVHNDVEVIWWVEADILNIQWDICATIQDDEPKHIVLSAHKDVYADDPASVTDATIAAIERYHEKIFCIGHPCNAWDFGDSYDIKRLATVANKYNIPLEVNAKNLLREKTNLTQLDTMIKTADTLCLNSDAHTLYELQESRTFAKKYLTDKGYI